MTGSAKTRHNSAFFNFHFYNLHTQMYVLAKFQLCILKAFEVIALQSSSNRKIDLYIKWREKNYRCLLSGCNLQMKWCTDSKFTIMFSVNLPCITTNKVETLIANNHFDITWMNGHILQFLWCTVIKQRFSSSSCLGK